MSNTDYSTLRDSRKRQYLNVAGADKPLKSPVSHAVLESARRYRISRIRKKLLEHNCDAIILYDPVNIRYAFDAPNMQVWTMHNPLRYGIVFAQGPAVMFEFASCEHLCEGIETIDEVRTATGWMYMTAGDQVANRVKKWSDEIAALISQHAGKNARLAADRLDFLGQAALERHGISVVAGDAITEEARSIKSAEEIELMRWTIRVCEASMARIYEHSIPGVTEQELWAHMSFENSRSGGEWLETRLLTAGSHTNPWYAECSDRVCNLGEMISFDTDMVGPYGYCTDLSRSWTCGYTKMTSKQKDLYSMALDQINHNLAIIADGVSFVEFNEQSWQIPLESQPFRYSLAAHGVGMADEWPIILLHPDFPNNHGGHFEENMVICVESLIAEPGTESIKLETQALVTKNGIERLDTFPWETD